MILNKQAILGADDLARETVYVKEWGGDVLVKGLSHGEMAQAQTKARDGSQMDLLIQVVIFGCIDEDGKHIFSQKDVKALMGKNQNPIVTLTNKIFELSGFGLSEEEEKEETGN